MKRRITALLDMNVAAALDGEAADEKLYVFKPKLEYIWSIFKVYRKPYGLHGGNILLAPKYRYPVAEDDEHMLYYDTRVMQKYVGHKLAVYESNLAIMIGEKKLRGTLKLNAPYDWVKEKDAAITINIGIERVKICEAAKNKVQHEIRDLINHVLL